MDEWNSSHLLHRETETTLRSSHGETRNICRTTGQGELNVRCICKSMDLFTSMYVIEKNLTNFILLLTVWLKFHCWNLYKTVHGHPTLHWAINQTTKTNATVILEILQPVRNYKAKPSHYFNFDIKCFWHDLWPIYVLRSCMVMYCSPFTLYVQVMKYCDIFYS